jgi:hypothetical protein
MATYTIDTASTVLSATTGADSIFIQSGAAGGSSIFGVGGNDTITIEGGVSNSSAAGLYLNGAAGDDQFNLSAQISFSAGDSTVFGGEGADSLNLSGTDLSLAKLGNGNDVVRANSLSGTVSALTLGAGTDNVTLSGRIGNLYLGSGHDLVSGSTINSLTGSSVRLGDGRDTIVATMGGASAVSVIGDSSAAAADVITLSAVTENSSVKGVGGNDTITLGTTQGISALIAGNAGNDSIVFSGAFSTGSTVGGGQGNDTINFVASDANFTGDSFFVKGGAGADSITFASIGTGAIATTGLQVQGGVGADSITYATVLSGAVVGTMVYSSLGETNLADGIDVLTISGDIATSSGTFFVDFSNSAHLDTVGDLSGSVLFNSTTNKATMTNGLVVLSGSTNVSSFTAAMSTVDTLTLSYGEGSTALFKTKGGDQYLFMQGGSTGTADDAIMQIAGVSGTNLAVSSALKVVYSGALG